MRNQSPGAHDLHSVNSIRSASISSLDVQDDSVTRQHETSKAADDAGHPLWVRTHAVPDLSREWSDSCVWYGQDFGNVLKAFIGSNYLSMPFSLRTAGLWAGLVGLAIIAVVTRSGCALLVKVKRVQEKKYGVHTYGASFRLFLCCVCVTIFVGRRLGFVHIWRQRTSCGRYAVDHNPVW